MSAKLLSNSIYEKERAGISNKNSIDISVFDDFVMVNRVLPSNAEMIESKSVKIDRDVFIQIEPDGAETVCLHCIWLFRTPTSFHHLHEREAQELKKVIEKMSTAKKNLWMQEIDLKGVLVGSQVWSDKNIDIDMGMQSVFPKYGDLSIRNYGRLYTYEGAEQAADFLSGWRLPTKADFEELIHYLDFDPWNELTKNLDFMLAGFHSKKIDSKRLSKYLEANPTLKIKQGGFYWTSDNAAKEIEGKTTFSRTFMHLNRFSKVPVFDETSASNENLFSLRLIRTSL